MYRKSVLCISLIFAPAITFATIFGSVRGIIHDPEHRPLQGAMVMLRAKNSDWAKSTNTNEDGQFEFNAVPIGEYNVVVAEPGFAQVSEGVSVRSDSEPVLHLALKVAAKN